MKTNDMYMLDNAAKIYPAAMSKKWNMVYRLSAYLKSEVNPQVLAKAAADLAPRFPTFYVQLHKGTFWFYLKKITDFDMVSKEGTKVCEPMQIGGNKPLFRILYNKNKVSVEFFHVLTDGTGASIYLKTLIARYFELQGHYIEKNNEIFDINDKPTEAEIEDSYQALYKRGCGISRKEADAYQWKTEKSLDDYNLTQGIIEIDSLKAVTKEKYNCTITEYLTAVYAYSFLQHYLKDNGIINSKRPIKISVPVNLRPYFDSHTIRNFASFVNVEIYPKKTKTLQDMILVIRKQMSELVTKDRLHRMVSQNVHEEKMLITKIAPNLLKTPVMKICYNMFGDRKYTSTLTNIGFMKLPDSLEKFVDRFDCVLGGGVGLNALGCAVVGFKNKLTVSISSTTTDTSVQNCFFDTMVKDGAVISFDSVKTETDAA